MRIFVPLFYGSFFHPAENDDAFVGIVKRVEDQCLEVLLPDHPSGRDLLHDLL